MTWDNASWHGSRVLRGWLRRPNRKVKRIGAGGRMLACVLPSKIRWLNAIEAHRVYGKPRVAEAERALIPADLADRVCAADDCSHEPHPAPAA